MMTQYQNNYHMKSSDVISTRLHKPLLLWLPLACDPSQAGRSQERSVLVKEHADEGAELTARSLADAMRPVG